MENGICMDLHAVYQAVAAVPTFVCTCGLHAHPLSRHEAILQKPARQSIILTVYEWWPSCSEPKFCSKNSIPKTNRHIDEENFLAVTCSNGPFNSLRHLKLSTRR
jgi:hypothetical protein